MSVFQYVSEASSIIDIYAVPQFKINFYNLASLYINEILLGRLLVYSGQTTNISK